MRRCWLPAAGRVSKRSIACAAGITGVLLWASVAISQVSEWGTGRLEKSVLGATIDEVIALHAAGFKKVAEAQRRE